MNRLFHCALAVAFIASLLPAIAVAGVVIEVATHGPKGSMREGTSTLYADPDRLSVRNAGNWAIFRGDKQVMWLVMEKEGKYTEVAAADVQQVEQQMSGAMAEMQKQLAELPPEQRAMAEKMMAGRMPGQTPGAKAPQAPEPLTYKKTGKSETINGHACVSYDTMRGGKRVSEVWVADWKQFDLKPDDFKVLGDFAAFTKKLVGPMAKQFDTGFERSFSDGQKADGLPGVPVRTISFTDKGEVVTELKRLAKEEIPASQFDVPAGLKKEAMMEKARGGPKAKGGEEGK